MNFVYEIMRSSWAILPEVAMSYKQNIRRLLSGETFLNNFDAKENSEPYQKSSFFDKSPNQQNNATQPKAIGVVELHGAMSKYGGPSHYGTRDLSAMVRAAAMDETVKGIILHVDSPGGSTASVFPMIEAIEDAKKVKPVVAYVDDMAASAAYLIAIHADEVIASHDMSEIGSIGVMATLINDKKALEKKGIEIIKITPPQSEYKQKGVDMALDGDPEMLIMESLVPWATFFQETVKMRRKNIDLSVEGIISGKMFYGGKAKQSGMIDAIGSFDYALERINSLYNARNLKKSLLSI
jgi:protease IV